MWKKTIDTQEVISYEFQTDRLKSIIEARYNKEDNCWDIYCTSFSTDNRNYTQEFTATTRDEAQKLILSLQDKEALADGKITELCLKESKKLRLDMQRSFKDYNVEKWVFFVDKDPFENSVFVRDSDIVLVDIILHETYKSREARIIKEMYRILGLHGLDLDIQQHLFYYNKRKEEVAKSMSSLLLGSVGLDSDVDEEEE